MNDRTNGVEKIGSQNQNQKLPSFVVVDDNTTRMTRGDTVDSRCTKERERRKKKDGEDEEET